MQAHLDEFRAMEADIVAVSSSSRKDHESVARRIGAEFPLLSDPDGRAIRAYGLFHPGALPMSDMPVARPAIFLVDPEGAIRQRFLPENWRVRERPKVLLEELERLQDRQRSP